MRRWRIAFAAAGILLALFGAFRLVTQVPLTDVVILAVWLVGVVVIHDGVLSPLLLAVGAVVTRLPARARRYVQFALVVGDLVMVIGLVLVARRNTQPSVKALLLRDYAANLALLLGLVAAASLVAYAVHVVRDRPTQPSSDRPDADG